MRNELTRKDIEDMEKEIEYRKLVVRPKALDDVKEARALGDLSENFEYHAAKKFKNENESRIRYLERMVKTAVVIDDGSTSAEDEVSAPRQYYVGNTNAFSCFCDNRDGLAAAAVSVKSNCYFISAGCCELVCHIQETGF